MPALDCAPGHMVGPSAPDPKRSACVGIPLIERTALAPKRERRTCDTQTRLAIPDVVSEIDAGRGAIFFADGVHGRRVAQCPDIGGADVGWEAVGIGSPCAKRVLDD